MHHLTVSFARSFDQMFGSLTAKIHEATSALIHRATGRLGVTLSAAATNRNDAAHAHQE
jgi:hypothetical protein